MTDRGQKEQGSEPAWKVEADDFLATLADNEEAAVYVEAAQKATNAFPKDNDTTKRIAAETGQVAVEALRQRRREAASVKIGQPKRPMS